MNEIRADVETYGHSKNDLFWYATFRPRIWSKIIEDTFTRLGWENIRGKKVLEIGYAGRMAVMFARHGAQYVGYEIDSRQPSEATKIAEKAGVLESTEFRMGDFMDIEFDEKFDYVFVKSVLYYIREERTYRMWLGKINSLLAPRGKFIALENAVGVSVNRWIRKYLLRAGHRVDALLYSPPVEQIFRETFSKVDVQYFYVLAHLTPWPRFFAKLEGYLVKPSAKNCFAVSLICEKS